MVLLPQGLKALKQVVKEVGLDLRGALLNLDGGFDSAHNRKCIFNAGLIPNIPENPRNRKRPKRGRKRRFNPRSRGTDSLDVFLPGGHFRPRVVKAKRITAHQVRREESNHLLDCCLVSSHAPLHPYPVALCRAFWRGSNGAAMQENPR
jgi:hypothetical protein